MKRRLYLVNVFAEGEASVVVYAKSKKQAEEIAMRDAMDHILASVNLDSDSEDLLNSDLSEYSDDLDDNGIPKAWLDNNCHVEDLGEMISLREAIAQIKVKK